MKKQIFNVFLVIACMTSMMVTPVWVAAEVDTSSTVWSEWGQWQTDATPTTTATLQVETKIQWRTTRSTQESTAATLPGWELDTTVPRRDNPARTWTGWSTTSPSEKDGRKIERRTVQVPVVQEYQYYVYKNANGNKAICPYDGVRRFGGKMSDWSKHTSSWRTSKMQQRAPGTAHTCPGGISGDSHTAARKLEYVYYPASNPDDHYYGFETRNSSPTSYEWRYSDNAYIYTFYQYSDWGVWSDTDVAGDDTPTVQYRTVWRTRTSMPEISKISAVGSNSVSVNLSRPHQDGAILVAAIYNSNKKLLGMKFEAVTASGEMTISNITIPTNVGTAIRVMMWDNMGNVQPLCESKGARYNGMAWDPID